MFGNNNATEDQNIQDQDFTTGMPASGAAPTLPTMGGQGFPLGPPTDNASNQQVESQVGTDHMLTENGTPDTPAQSPPPPAGPASDLVNLKQQALQQLSPLVSHLDQTPEEKFRTTMMMIQATDDQSLLQPAYEAAQKIEDDKARAQALLDVINEINYFSQQNKS